MRILKYPDSKKTLFLIIIILNLLFIMPTDAFSGSNDSKTYHNINQGNIILFLQNYTEMKNIPKNVFIAAPPYKTERLYLLYSLVYGTYSSELTLDNTSQGFKFITIKETNKSLSSLFSILETIINYGIKKYREYYYRDSEGDKFCNGASIPLIQCTRQPILGGSLYISNFVPMVKSTYQISLNIKTDRSDSLVEVKSPASRLIIQVKDNSTVLKSFYRNSSGEFTFKIISIGNASDMLEFNITFDGYNKTNTIYTNNDNYIITPFYDIDRQNLPYVDFSGGYIKITNYVLGKGTYLDVDVFQIIQKAERKFITSIGDRNMTAFGLDGPHPKNTTEKGINLIDSKRFRGTIWVDAKIIEKYNETDVQHFRNLIINDSWELGIHYSEELKKLPLEQAYKLMEEEYSYVYEKIGRKPTTWCSMRNNDNLSHAIYAYEKFEMIWRNGDAGIQAENLGGVGNLDDDTWVWWKSVSNAGMIYPVFTHRTDENPSIEFSISFPRFQTWVNNYELNNISIVPFYKYWKTNSNTYYAYFDNIEYNADFIKFNANTNGANALINVNINAKNDTKIFDNTSERVLDYKIEQDKSITFWAKNGHTYRIYF